MHSVATLFVGDKLVVRPAAEEQLARQLAAHGMAATPAYTVLGNTDVTDIVAVKAKLKSLGYDGLAVMKVVDREQEIDYMPGGYYGWYGWYGGYGASDYAYTTDIVRMSTELYSLKTDRIVWSGLTRTDDPENAQDMVNSASKVIASEIVQRSNEG